MNNGTEPAGSSRLGAGPFFLGVLIGAVIGGVAALMLAPKSGAETREMIRNRYNQMSEVVRNSAQDVKNNIQGMKES
jgi:gas vesicle protein